jgi:hypothetical protein
VTCNRLKKHAIWHAAGQKPLKEKYINTKAIIFTTICKWFGG